VRVWNSSLPPVEELDAGSLVRNHWLGSELIKLEPSLK
jgi:hypothetical protein